MILINVSVPFLGQTYDFKTEENAPCYQVIQDMLQMISHNEHIPVSTTGTHFILSSKEKGKILSPMLSLKENGIGYGEGLTLL